MLFPYGIPVCCETSDITDTIDDTKNPVDQSSNRIFFFEFVRIPVDNDTTRPYDGTYCCIMRQSQHLEAPLGISHVSVNVFLGPKEFPFLQIGSYHYDSAVTSFRST